MFDKISSLIQIINILNQKKNLYTILNKNFLILLFNIKIYFSKFVKIIYIIFK